jgi:hypothetical protein
MSLSSISGYVTSVLLEGFEPVPVPPEEKFAREYNDIFIKVRAWGSFEGPDIERNNIDIHWEAVPEFVAKFEQELDSEPGVAHDVCCFLHHFFYADRSM